MNVLTLALIIYLSAGFGVAVTITSIVSKMDDEQKSAKVMVMMFFVLMLFWVFFIGNPIEVKHGTD